MNSWLSHVRGTFIIRESEFSNNALINQVNEVLLEEMIVSKFIEQKKTLEKLKE